METEAKNPLIEALPPATDYMTYLTVLEYNLNAENVHVLESLLLNDAELTVNIGWDLVHLLLPFLPGSYGCLLTVARAGNPREVVLKVTECLRALQVDDASEDTSEDEDGDGTSKITDSHTEDVKVLEVAQFDVLLSMLSILHPRIKTKTPSRFLATSLEAIVATLSRATFSVDALTTFVLRFLEDLKRQQAPVLPRRLTQPSTASEYESSAASDVELEERLVQAFLTHVTEIYMRSLSAPEDVPGLAWASRVDEKVRPARLVPGRRLLSASFEETPIFKMRVDTVKRIESLLYGLGSKELLHTALQAPQPITKETDDVEEIDLPDVPNDIPLSANGSLLLLADRTCRAIIEGTDEPLSRLKIFPDHARIVDNFLGENAVNAIQVGPAETEALVDAIVVLGRNAFDMRHIGQPEDDDTFNRYLQLLSMLSADSRSPSLRYQAHMLVTNVLHSHPSDSVRLYFIRDTLEHCPYENLKVSAVGWLKEETLEACSTETRAAAQSQTAIFATRVALDTTAAFLFPDLTDKIIAPDELDTWVEFKANLSFYMSVLNFYYLVLSAPQIRGRLQIAGLHEEHNVDSHYVWPLRESCKVFAELPPDSVVAQVEGAEGMMVARMDMMLLEDVLSRVVQAVKALSAPTSLLTPSI